MGNSATEPRASMAPVMWNRAPPRGRDLTPNLAAWNKLRLGLGRHIAGHVSTYCLNSTMYA